MNAHSKGRQAQNSPPQIGRIPAEIWVFPRALSLLTKRFWQNPYWKAKRLQANLYFTGRNKNYQVLFSVLCYLRKLPATHQYSNVNLLSLWRDEKLLSRKHTVIFKCSLILQVRSLVEGIISSISFISCQPCHWCLGEYISILVLHFTASLSNQRFNQAMKWDLHSAHTQTEK